LLASGLLGWVEQYRRTYNRVLAHFKPLQVYALCRRVSEGHLVSWNIVFSHGAPFVGAVSGHLMS
jgi:hypothetical protein